MLPSLTLTPDTHQIISRLWQRVKTILWWERGVLQLINCFCLKLRHFILALKQIPISFDFTKLLFHPMFGHSLDYRLNILAFSEQLSIKNTPQPLSFFLVDLNPLLRMQLSLHLLIITILFSLLFQILSLILLHLHFEILR